MFDDDFELFNDLEKSSLTISQQWCNHEWKSILLLTSSVFDCKKCGYKREDWEKENIPDWKGL